MGNCLIFAKATTRHAVSRHAVSVGEDLEEIEESPTRLKTALHSPRRARDSSEGLIRRFNR